MARQAALNSSCHHQMSDPLKSPDRTELWRLLRERNDHPEQLARIDADSK